MNYIILGLLSAVSAALVAIFAKIGLKGVDSTVATTIRSFIMFIALLILVFSIKKFPQLFSLTGSNYWWIILSGIAGAASWFFYFWALQISTPSKVAALDRTSIIFVVIFAFLFLGDKFTTLTVLGSILISLGAFLMVLAK